MSLLEKLKDLFSKEAQKYVYASILHDHVQDPQYVDEPLEAGKHYFRLWLSEMFLEKEVDWFRTWHPMAHSLVVFQFGQQTIEIANVAGDVKLKVISQADLQKIIQLNYNMSALMPFNGGVVELVVALAAIKGGDNVASIIKVLGDLSNMLVVPQLSSALNVALPIASGVQDLLGGADGKIHLGMHQSFTGKGGGGSNVLSPGYIAIIRGAEKDYPVDRLWVRNDQLRIGNSQETSGPLSGVTYMLFRIESRTERDDWRLKNIQEAFDEALKSLAGGEEAIKAALHRVTVLVLTSPDLTRADRTRVLRALREEFEQARKEGLGAIPMAERNIESLIRRRGGDIEDALAEPLTLTHVMME
jgi:hypothetical protein